MGRRTESGHLTTLGYADYWPLTVYPTGHEAKAIKAYVMVTIGALIALSAALIGIFVMVFRLLVVGIDCGRKRLFAAYFMLSASFSYFSARSRAFAPLPLGDPPYPRPGSE